MKISPLRIAIMPLLVLAGCVSSAGRVDEVPAEPRASAEREASEEPEEWEVPALPAPPEAHASEAYDEWCVKTDYAGMFAGRELPEPKSVTSQEFDAEGRVIRREYDRNGDGEANTITVTAYEDDGIGYTSKTDRDADGEFDTETKGERRSEETRRYDAPGRSHRLGDGAYARDEDGHKVGYRKSATRLVEENGARREIEVDEVGVFLLDDAGHPLVEFIVQGEALPDIEELRDAFHHDEDEGRWTWRDRGFFLQEVALYAYDEDHHELAEVVWRDPGEGGVPDVAAITSALRTREPHPLESHGGVTRPISPLPDEIRDHLEQATLRRYDGEGRKLSEREFGFKPPGPIRYARFEYDGEGNVTRTVSDVTDRRPNSMIGDGIVDRIEEQSYESGELVSKTVRHVGFSPELAWGRIPEAWRTVAFAGLDEADPVEPEIALGSEVRVVRDEHGNILEQRTETIAGEHELRYGDDGRLIEETIDGAPPEEWMTTLQRNGVPNIRIRREYDDEGRLARKAHTELETRGGHVQTLTEYRYDDRGRLVLEEVSRAGEDGADAEPLERREHVYEDDLKARTTVEYLRHSRRDEIIEYIYDDDDRLTSERRKIDKVVETRRYLYEAGRLVAEEVQLEDEDEAHYRVEYEYDAQGRERRALHLGLLNVRPARIPPRPHRMTEYAWEDDQLVGKVYKETRAIRYDYACHEARSP